MAAAPTADPGFHSEISDVGVAGSVPEATVEQRMQDIPVFAGMARTTLPDR
ncbi:hypothetical protein [Mycobacterium branderi]|uniref:hypothetical protein n=1 Tax=Mycobacterium branderi TaxID=43348 RepID=UPI0013D0F7AF|nr:hypothetical protein [Mycobacterium branderi]MCV7236322.1 hypothetical protein [Mycobacterium branderi]